GAGKSILTAGICRVLTQDGYRVAPFKSQNMALNSYVTLDGKEIGRAQAVQAFACNRKPDVTMNPILLKPMGDSISQIIVNGESIGNMRAADYFKMKKNLIPDIKAAYEKLSEDSDVVVIEGAGSPAEINLRENDIVNMGLAEILDAPVLLVGNIDPGGVFAQLLGTVNLLSKDEQTRIKGLIINKFRGDVKLLEPGLDMFKAYCDIPFAGVVPFADLDIEEEDSISSRLRNGKADRAGTSDTEDKIKISVIRLPYISNYTDFSVLESIDTVDLSYVKEPSELAGSDLIILPGTKSTISDLSWLKEAGFDKAIKNEIDRNALVIGICGGFQMLGRNISDPMKVETGGDVLGLGLLPVDTEFKPKKTLTQTSCNIGKITGTFEPLSGSKVKGYEIHMGVSGTSDSSPVITKGSVFGTYLHGIFDTPEFTRKLMNILYDRRGLSMPDLIIESATEHRDKEFDKLADILRESLDWKLIYKIIGI
nr:cobyric acid synthase [Butyrivibrio sp.]